MDAKELKKLQIIEDYKTVLDTAAGKRIFWHITMDVCGFKRTAADISNVNNTFFELGKRKIAEAILNKLENIDPMYTFKMARENTKIKKKK